MGFIDSIVTCDINLPPTHPVSMQHTDLQLSLAQKEKSYFEIKLMLDRVSGEKQALLQENRSLERGRDELRHKLRQLTEENVQIKDRWVYFTVTGVSCPK